MGVYDSLFAQIATSMTSELHCIGTSPTLAVVGPVAYPGRMTAIILASASPRRQRLARWLSLPFSIAISDIEDDPHIARSQHPERLAEQLALAKARHVAERIDRPAVVLGFDTLVVTRGRVLGKPQDVEEARFMLDMLSGRTHEVVTGVAAVATPEGTHESLTHISAVLMKKLSADDVERWLGGDEALGCAGAYNIERHLATVQLNQCFQNVAGLPLCHTFKLLKTRFGFAPSRPDTRCDAARGVKCLLAPRVVGCAATSR